MTQRLTLESMRADIAAAIGIPADEIGDHDNLADLGLDSMRAMMLVERWNATGVNLAFSEMADRVELASWHAIVARQQAAAALASVPGNAT